MQWKDDKDCWKVTLWYSTLGVGDGHDFATRGYLTALMAAGYEGIRIPPSVTSAIMRFDTIDPDILKFRELAQPPKHLRMKPLERIGRDDPRLHERQIGVDVEGNPIFERVGEQEIECIDEFGKKITEKIVLCEGAVDISKPQQFTSNVKLAVECVVIHHDPSSIARNFTNFTKLKKPEGVAYVGITVWETDSIPDPVARILSELDCIVVPSWHTRNAFENSNVDTRIVVIPHTFDPDLWKKPRPEDFEREQDRKYVFYGIGTPIERKNIATLFRAYFTAFEGRDDVVLRFKSSGEHAALIAVAKKALEASGIDPSKRPAVRLFTDQWNTEKMRNFHIDGDCYVSATRAEGFGLCEFEAKLCGSRVITTGWGSAPEFLRAEDGDLLVPSKLVPVEGMFGIGCYDPKQSWADPDFDALVESMRTVERQRMKPDMTSWDRLLETHGPELIGDKLSGELLSTREDVKEGATYDEFWAEKTEASDRDTVSDRQED
jgi:glycosyltransferase involved in cell wall biosynthesis